MKKKILLTILLLSVFLQVNAKKVSTYDDAVSNVNNYMYSSGNYQKYFVSSSNIPFVYNNNTVSVDSSFKTGGLLNRSEYRISFNNSDSYLNNGINYWLVKDGSDYYAITDSKKGIDSVSTTSSSSNYSTRVVEYLNNNINVSGSGTYLSPLKISQKYRVEFSTDSNKVKIDPLLHYVSTTDSWVSSKFLVRYGYQYDEDNSECNLSYQTSHFDEDGNEVTEYDATGQKITGYIKKDSLDTLTSDIKCKVAVKPISYSINYNLNNGVAGSSHPSSAKYDEWVVINNPTKTITFNISNEAEATITNNNSYTQEFTGWTIAGMDNLVKHYYGNSKSNTSYTSGSSLSSIKNTYFLNLTATNNSTITYTANWKSTTVTLPTIVKAGNACGWTINGTTYSSGASYSIAANANPIIQLVSTCVPCVAGTYNTGTDNTPTCTTCPTNYYTNTGDSAGATSCTICPAGSACGGKTKVVCAQGSYASGTGNTACTACLNGKTTSGTGQTSCNATCSNAANVVTWEEATWTNNTVTNLCKIKSCESGYIIENNKCKLNTVTCAAGKYLAANAKSCSDCTTGHYCSGGTYTPSTADQGITACKAGTYASTTGNSVCSVCAAGTYSSSGQSSCTPCDAGTYNTGTGNTTCTSCSAGTYNTGTGNTACSSCPAGSYCSGGSAITVCPAGTYSAAGKSGCTTCSAGTYNTTTGNSSCTTCPAGYYCTGGTSKTACAAGTYAAAGKSSCTNCWAGSYNTGTGNSTCTSCAAGTYQASTGKTSCSTCSSGYYTNTGTSAGATSCTICPAGYSCNGKSKTVCPAGTYNTGTGNSSCTTCAAGTYNSGTGNTSCTTCPAGSYCTGGTSKTVCPAGTYSGSGKSSCTNCWAGSYNTGTGNTTCTACAAGKYQPYTGQTSCYTCSSGYYTNKGTSTGATSCTICSTGHYCNGQTSTACAAGTYQGSTGQSSCNSCAAGKYASGTGNTSCTACAAGYYQPYTGKSSCYSCSAGTYSSGTGNTSCTACAAGKYASGTGNTSCTACAAGKYASGTGNSSCTACPAGKYASGTGNSSCTACAAGYYQGSTGQTSCTACGAGYYTDVGATTGGTTCTQCQAGYYCTGNGARVACTGGHTSSAGATDCSTTRNITRCIYISSGDTATYIALNHFGVGYSSLIYSTSNYSGYDWCAASGCHCDISCCRSGCDSLTIGHYLCYYENIVYYQRAGRCF